MANDAQIKRFETEAAAIRYAQVESKRMLTTLHVIESPERGVAGPKRPFVVDHSGMIRNFERLVVTYTDGAIDTD